MEIVRKEGNRNVNRKLEFYNLDAIIAVGYRVNSKKATKIRIWATQILKNYITKSFDDILVQRYIQQYSNVTIKNNNLFHDRYIILDRKTIYISGSSLKDIGKKYSYIYKINEEMFIEELIKRVENIV